jgi:hypothetical protein
MDSSHSAPTIQKGHWTGQRFYESVPQQDEPTQHILHPIYRSKDFQSSFLAPSPQYEQAENGSLTRRKGGNPVSSYLKDNRYNFFATVPLLAAVLEISLLVYFITTYVSLPRDPKTGALPRISPVYSTWPFTSCIGGIRLAVYKTFALVVASLFQCGCCINLYLTWKKESGYWFRRVGAVAGLTSSVLLISLAFSSGNTKIHSHLFLTAAKILATLTVKTNVFICDYLDRKAKPILNTIPAAIILKRWKAVVAGLSFGNLCPPPAEKESKTDRIPVFAIVVNLGIYRCTDPVLIQTPGTTCFEIMAVGAPAEWLMSILWITFMLSMAYDFYTTPQISAVVRAVYNAGEGPDTLKSKRQNWGPSVEDFEFDEANRLTKSEYPAKAWRPPSPAEES